MTITHFLRHIPRSDHEPMRLSILAQRLNVPEAELSGIAQVLVLLGMVILSPTPHGLSIQSSSQAAYYGLHSLAEYAQNNLPLIADWEKSGIETTFVDVLRNGASFVYIMEWNRLQRQENAQPIRYTRVAQAIIKRTVNGQPQILMQYDYQAQQYQLIGGRWRNDDGPETLITLVREIAEELPHAKLLYPHDYQLRPLVMDYVTQPELSPTFGALTQYRFDVYHLHGLSQPLDEIGSADAWIPLANAIKGIHSGQRVSDACGWLDQRLDGDWSWLADSYHP